MLYCGHGITFGNEVLVAAGCIFVPANHAVADISRSIRVQGTCRQKVAWLSRMMSGLAPTAFSWMVPLSRRGAVINAGSVVSGEIAPYSIAGWITLQGDQGRVQAVSIMAERFSVFGASGACRTDASPKHSVRLARHAQAIGRAPWPAKGTDLGHIIYAIGVTADFRKRPHEAVEAHVGCLSRVMQDYAFESLTYMSSARVYRCVVGEATEDAQFILPPHDPDKLYELSKLLGRMPVAGSRPTRASGLCACRTPTVQGIPRPNFLPSVLAEAARTGAVEIRQSPASRKDYIALDDAVAAIIAIATRGTEPVYTVASGRMVSHGEIAAVLRDRCGIDVRFAEGGAR